MTLLTQKVGKLQHQLYIDWKQHPREDIISEYLHKLQNSAVFIQSSYQMQIAAEKALITYAEGIGAY